MLCYDFALTPCKFSQRPNWQGTWAVHPPEEPARRPRRSCSASTRVASAHDGRGVENGASENGWR